MNKITRSLKSSISVKNPFQTPVGRFVEHLTESNSLQEIQDGLSHLYREMNESDSGPKHAAKALRFRMTRSSPLAFKTLLNTLTILEGCMKHCGRRFHQHVAKKSFLADYGHLILPKYAPAEEVRQRAIALLQSWLEMFSGQPELMEFERFYQELQADVSLSMPSAAPIRRAGSDSSLTAGGGPGVNVYSPPREPSRTTTLGGHRHSHSHTASRNRPGSVAYPTAQFAPNAGYYSGGIYYSPPQAYAGGALSGPPMSVPADVDSPQSESSPSQPLSPEKVAKLNAEIDTVLENANILGELIANNNPGHESVDEFQLMTDMHDQCKKMQERIMNLLPKLSQENEGALSKLLSANDKLGEVFILFDSYVAERDRLTNRRAVDRSPEVAHRAGAAGAARSPGDPPDAGAANPRPPSFTDLPPAYPKVASTSALSYSRPAPPPEPEVDLSSNAPRNAGAGSSANDLLLDLDPLNAPPGSQPMASGVGAFGMAAQPQPQPAPSAAMFSQMLSPPMAPTGGLSSNNPFAPAAASAYSLSGPLSSGYGNLGSYAPTGGSLYGGQPPYTSMSLRPAGSAGGINSALNNPAPPPPQTETLSSGARAPASATASGVGASGNYSNSAWLKFEEEGGIGALTGSSAAGGAGAAAPNFQYASNNASMQPSAQYPSLSGMTSANLTAARSGGGAPPARATNSIPEGDNPLISF